MRWPTRDLGLAQSDATSVEAHLEELLLDVISEMIPTTAVDEVEAPATSLVARAESRGTGEPPTRRRQP